MSFKYFRLLIILLKWQTVSGRLKLATSVLLRSIGAAVEFAILLIGLRRSTEDVEKVRTLSGMQLFDVLSQGNALEGYL